jgi:6-phosphofructo-2-kinase/fructose-2,6-biphosphatase 2
VGQLRRTRAKQKAQQYVLIPFLMISGPMGLCIVNSRLGIKEDHTASWFSHENEAANLSRERLAQDSLEMLIAWLKQGGNVGIHGMCASFIPARACSDCIQTQQIALERAGQIYFSVGTS